MSNNPSQLPPGGGNQQAPNKSLITSPENPLTPQQQTAMEHLAAGKSVMETAGLAGVSRRSIQLWLKNDPHFRAAFNAWRTETAQNAQARLLAMADAAATAVGKAIDPGNAQAALVVLKGMGVLAPPKIGSDDPAVLKSEAAIEADEVEMALEGRRRTVKKKKTASSWTTW